MREEGKDVPTWHLAEMGKQQKEWCPCTPCAWMSAACH